MSKSSAALALAPLVVAVLAGCSGTSSTSSTTATATATSSESAVEASALPASVAAAPDTPGTSQRPVTATSGGTGTPVAVPTQAAVKFSSAKLPASVDGYTGVVTPNGPGQVGQYTGQGPDDIMTVTLNPISATGAMTRLQSPTTVGQAVCGAATDGSGMTCVVALDGGQLLVQGSDTSTAASLGATTNAILKTFA